MHLHCSLRRLLVLWTLISGASAGPFAYARGSVTTGAQQPPKLRLSEVEDLMPTSYKIDLTLDPAKDAFRGSIRIAVDVKTPLETVWLNASQISLQDISVSAGGKTTKGSAVAGDEDFVGLKFESPLPSGSAEIRIDYTGAVRRGQTSGIFFSEDGGNRYLLTQFEPTDARDAFPCFDEPSYKVPWQLTLHVPAGNEAISNTPVASRSESGGTETIVFGQTKPLPSYLVALGVGPFEFVNAGVAGKNHVPVRIVTPKGRTNEAKYAAEVTATILSRLEDYFGIPYPYEKADQVAIPITAGFAMENAAMVTYGGSIILAKPASDSIRRQREYALVAAHELAHQWFGDLVTTAWWNDIWLNEAFATWMEQKLIAEWKPEWGTRAQDVAGLQGAEREDALSSTRKITQEIESKADIQNAFDNITYQKGGAVIGMFESWIGPEAFRSGVRSYLNQFAFKTATTADFLHSLSSASGKDLTSAFSTFTNQPGIPVVSMTLKCGQGEPTLILEQRQFHPLGAKASMNNVWSIPVCVRSGSGDTGQKQCTLLTQSSRDWTLDAKSCPAWIEGKADATGYYRVRYQGELFSALMNGDVEHRLNAAERVDLMENMRAGYAAGLVPYAEALELASRFRSDPDPNVVRSVISLLEGLGSGYFVKPALLANYRRFVLATFQTRARELDWNAKAGESEAEQVMRPYLLGLVSRFGGDEELVREAQGLAQKWLAGDRSLNPNIVESVLQTYAYYGNKSTAEQLLSAYKASKDLQEHDHVITGMMSFRDPAAMEVALQAFQSGDISPSQSWVFLAMGQSSTEGRKVPFEFLKAHFKTLEPKFSGSMRGYLPFLGASFCDTASRTELKDFFEPRVDELPGARRTLAQALETIDVCIATKEVQEPSVSKFLQDK